MAIHYSGMQCWETSACTKINNICMVKARDFRMAGNYNFRGKSEKALKINFRVFVTATSPEAWHCCTNDDVIDTSATIKVIPTEL